MTVGMISKRDPKSTFFLPNLSQKRPPANDPIIKPIFEEKRVWSLCYLVAKNIRFQARWFIYLWENWRNIYKKPRSEKIVMNLKQSNTLAMITKKDILACTFHIVTGLCFLTKNMHLMGVFKVIRLTFSCKLAEISYLYKQLNYQEFRNLPNIMIVPISLLLYSSLHT